MSGPSQVKYYRVWHGIREFCGDCTKATTCEIRRTVAARTCGYVLEQRAEDRRTGKRRLVAFNTDVGGS